MTNEISMHMGKMYYYSNTCTFIINYAVRTFIETKGKLQLIKISHCVCDYGQIYIAIFNPNTENLCSVKYVLANMSLAARR